MVRIEEDRWLSERFGHPVFSVGVGGADGPDATAIGDHAAVHAPASYQCRLPAERPAELATLIDAGFAVVNLTITLMREPGAVGGGDEVEVRHAEAEGDRAVIEIAERAFTKSRFHLDPAIPAAVANRVKRDWAESSLNGARGDGMLVALDQGVPVGFLAGLSSEGNGRRARVIDLIAVDSAARGRGAGRALVAEFVAAAAPDFDEVRVATQAANPAATRFYERLGFTVAECAYDLHLHAGTVSPEA